ncbi:hypothetical protein AMECASPLE_020767 [Ameca splendens]|uniref:Uncharacterized protein n=1 Tax=Ameca splendens TaxID=208324 RepID=A0ABV0ZCJ0_9TELE
MPPPPLVSPVHSCQGFSSDERRRNSDCQWLFWRDGETLGGLFTTGDSKLGWRLLPVMSFNESSETRYRSEVRGSNTTCCHKELSVTAFIISMTVGIFSNSFVLFILIKSKASSPPHQVQGILPAVCQQSGDH